ncbi:MAG: hypothetical protein Roseis3KO_55280 [Roseivirga sp.]
MLLIVALSGCEENKKTTNTADSVVDTVGMYDLLIPEIDIHGTALEESPSDGTFQIVSKGVIESKSCDKCDITVISFTDQHLDSLGYQDIYDLLCTIETTCADNIEFSEYSNEVLHRVLFYYTADFVLVASKFPYLMSSGVYSMLTEPLIDYDFDKLSLRLDSIEGDPEIIGKIKTTLENVNW